MRSPTQEDTGLLIHMLHKLYLRACTLKHVLMQHGNAIYSQILSTFWISKATLLAQLLAWRAPCR